MAPWNAAEMQASLRDQEVEARLTLQSILTRELLGEYRGSSTQTWHSLNADTDVLLTRRSSNNFSRNHNYGHCVLALAYLLLARLVVYTIYKWTMQLMLMYELIQVQNLSTPYTVDTFHTYMLEWILLTTVW